MSYDGNGNFNTINTFVFDTVISETEVNANFADIATGLSTVITSDGQSTISSNIPMDNNKFTGLSAGSAATDSLNLGQAQAGAFRRSGTAGGTKNALTISPSPAITAYATGQRFTAIIGGTSSDAATTITVSGLATKAVEIDNSALSAIVFLETAKTYDFEYDGVAFQATRLSLNAQPFDADILKADTPDNLTAGFSTTVYDNGTQTTGTLTPDQDNGNIQKAVNGGAHTLAPPTDDCTMILQYTNNGSAGAITTSGFTLVDGDEISTDDTDNFFFYITKANDFSLLSVKALQ